MQNQNSFKEKINRRAIASIRTLLDEIKNGTNQSQSLDSYQKNSQVDYAGRFFFELLQNAKDVKKCTEIKIILSDHHLLFCNNGTPVTDENFRAFCEPAISDKSTDPDQTGKYGIGKASFFEITGKNHCCISKADARSTSFDGYCFELASDRAAKYEECLLNLQPDSISPFGNIRIIEERHVNTINDVLAQDKDGEKRRRKLKEIIRNLPIPITKLPDEVQPLREKYSTVLFFTISEDRKKFIKDKLKEFMEQIPYIILFLQDVQEICVVCDGKENRFFKKPVSRKEISLYGEKRLYVGHSGPDGHCEEQLFMFWKLTATAAETEKIYSCLTSEKVKKRIPFTVEIATCPENPKISGLFICDLPTEDKTGLNAYINANFQTQSDRKSIPAGNCYNEEIINFIIEQYRKVVGAILKANNGIPTKESAHLLNALLHPLTPRSFFYEALSKSFNLGNYPCIYSTEHGKKCWSTPNEVYAALNHTWSAPIEASMFYKMIDHPVIDEECKKLSVDLAQTIKEEEVKKISESEQAHVLVKILKNADKNYFAVWKDIIEHWRELLQNQKMIFMEADIFRTVDGSLIPSQSIYRRQDRGSLIRSKGVGDIPYPFQLMDGKLAELFEPEAGNLLQGYFCSPAEINRKWCCKLIDLLASEQDEQKRIEYFTILVQDFIGIIGNFIEKVMFPCSQNEWRLYGDIYKGNGWGSEDECSLDFLKACGQHGKMAYLREKEADVWKKLDIGKLESIIGHLQEINLFEETTINIQCNINGIRKLSNASKPLRAILDQQIAEKNKTLNGSYYSDSRIVWPFPETLQELSPNIVKKLFSIINLKNNAELISESIDNNLVFYSESSYENYYSRSKRFECESPLKILLKTYQWIPTKDNIFVAPKEITFVNMSLKSSYPELKAYEDLALKTRITEKMRRLLIQLGAKEINQESDIPYDHTLLKLFSQNPKRLGCFVKKFWLQLCTAGFELWPERLPCKDSLGARCSMEKSGTLYIADVPEEKIKSYRKEYFPYLDIEKSVLENFPVWKDSSYRRYSELRGDCFADGIPWQEASSIPLCQYKNKNGMLAFGLLLCHPRNKKQLLEKLRQQRLIECDSLIVRLDNLDNPETHHSEPSCFIITRNNFMGLAKELAIFDKKLKESDVEPLLGVLTEDSSKEDVVTFLKNREVDFSEEVDIPEAAELLWGSENAVNILTRFIPLADTFRQRLKDARTMDKQKQLISKLPDKKLANTLTAFLDDPSPLPQRGKRLNAYREISLTEWNNALSDFGENQYVNEDFSKEFANFYYNSFSRFLKEIYIKTDHTSDDHFFAKALAAWETFDADSAAREFWSITEPVFNGIMHKFILENFPHAVKPITNKLISPYEIHEENKKRLKCQEYPAQVDLDENRYFLDIFPEEHFAASVQPVTAKPAAVPSVTSPKAFTTKERTGPAAAPVRNPSSEKQIQPARTATKPFFTGDDWESCQSVFHPFQQSPIPLPRQNLHQPPMSALLCDEDRVKIGKAGEKCLYRYLKQQYSALQIQWVSSYNPARTKADDSLGYDFAVTTQDGELYYIECKATTTEEGAAEIELGSTQVEKAKSCLEAGTRYSVYRLFKKNGKIHIYDLGNPLDQDNSRIKWMKIFLQMR